MQHDLDAERRLAVAVFDRAARDIQGAPIRSGGDVATGEARAWVTEAGPWFRWWCDVAGVDPERARAALLTRKKAR